MQQYFRLGFFWAFLGCFLPAMVDAASFPEVCFILDASGSMQAMVGGKTRMEAAKDVMSQIVPGLAPEVKVGLVAYGHRRNCR